MATKNNDDASNATQALGQFLSEIEATAQGITSPAGKTLGRRFKLRPQTAAAATTYSIPERHRIVAQLRLALVDFYVHLERKKAIYGFDPVRVLDLLEPTIESIADSEFHESVVQLIARTRDRHLIFRGRVPVGSSATLPFMIERCWAGNNVQYVVTKITNGFVPKHLKKGALVTHWNGIAIERLVRLNANIFDGGNEAAALARSLAFLTDRPLNRFGPPFEDWVDLRFIVDDTAYEERFAWEGLDLTQLPETPALGRNLTGFGGDLELLQVQHARRVRFAPSSFDAGSRTLIPGQVGVPQIIGSDPSGDFEYGFVTTTYGKFGYVRLQQFAANGPDDLVNAFIPALEQIPGDGLIIDMRGNSGGYIAAGERLLQLFAPDRITPTRFQFRVTAATRTMVASIDEFGPWRPSMEASFETGEPYSQGYPIEGTDDDANQVGQRYFGPVVLITDALAFSTADMFAAGFIDNEVGRVICTDENMAAAGGNNWFWDAIRLYNPDFHLDPALKPTFEAETLSQEMRDAFNREARLFLRRPCYLLHLHSTTEWRGGSPTGPSPMSSVTCPG